MLFLQSNITPIITTLTLVSHILFVVIVLSLFNSSFRSRIYDFVDKYVLSLLFVISTGAVVGSLAYSNIAGFPPCELCWIQRIFMFPQPILAFMAMLKKDKKMVGYLLPLSIIGILVAGYQSLSNWGIGGGLLECTAVGGDCSKVYVLEYGYITIPFMAFTVFAYLLLVSFLYYRAKNEE